MNWAIVISCEHASNAVPKRYAKYFAADPEVLQTHRGWDPGAKELAQRFAKRCRAPIWLGEVSRLLIELNRSDHHPHLFSEFMPEELDNRTELMRRYYVPYWSSLMDWLNSKVVNDVTVLHLGVHTFTPMLDGEVRQADVGLLYDPARPTEKAFCATWAKLLRQADPTLRVRCNYPYRGVADGLTTSLREYFPAGYLGIELEVNQQFPLSRPTDWQQLQKALVATFQQAIEAQSRL